VPVSPLAQVARLVQQADDQRTLSAPQPARSPQPVGDQRAAPALPSSSPYRPALPVPQVASGSPLVQRIGIQKERGIVTKYVNGQGQITGEQGRIYDFTYAHLEGARAFPGDRVTVEVSSGGATPASFRIQVAPRPQEEGYVHEFNTQTLFGRVARPNRELVPFHITDVENARTVRAGQLVHFEAASP